MHAMIHIANKQIEVDRLAKVDSCDNTAQAQFFTHALNRKIEKVSDKPLIRDAIRVESMRIVGSIQMMYFSWRLIRVEIAILEEFFPKGLKPSLVIPWFIEIWLLRWDSSQLLERMADEVPIADRVLEGIALGWCFQAEMVEYQPVTP